MAAMVASIMLGMILLIVIVRRMLRHPRRPARTDHRAQQDTDWPDSTPAFAFGSHDGGSTDSGIGDGGSDFSGDGGTFDGGGASGDWDD